MLFRQFYHTCLQKISRVGFLSQHQNFLLRWEILTCREPLHTGQDRHTQGFHLKTDIIEWKSWIASVLLSYLIHRNACEEPRVYLKRRFLCKSWAVITFNLKCYPSNEGKVKVKVISRKFGKIVTEKRFYRYDSLQYVEWDQLDVQKSVRNHWICKY